MHHRRGMSQYLLEMAGLWPHLMRDVRVRDVPMRDVPALVGCTGYVRTWGKDAQAEKTLSHPCLFSLFPFCFLSLVVSLSSFFSLLALLLPQVFPFVQLNTINDLNLHSIQTLCLHLSYSTPLRKTQTVNDYLRIEYFQQYLEDSNRVRYGDIH